MTSEFSTIRYEVEKGRARITLNRPEKLNALSMELQTELNQALWEADNDVNVHVVILRGAGRAFSAGYDLTPLASRRGDGADERGLARRRRPGVAQDRRRGEERRRPAPARRARP